METHRNIYKDTNMGTYIEISNNVHIVLDMSGRLVNFIAAEYRLGKQIPGYRGRSKTFSMF